MCWIYFIFAKFTLILDCALCMMIVFRNILKFPRNFVDWHIYLLGVATSLLEDEHITVRQKAAKVLGGLLHCGFVAGDTLTQLLDQFRDKVRVKMARKGRKYKRDVKEDKGEGAKLISLHSGILGLCAFVEAFPHDVPSFLPPILMELSTHLNDRQVYSCRKLWISGKAHYG